MVLDIYQHSNNINCEVEIDTLEDINNIPGEWHIEGGVRGGVTPGQVRLCRVRVMQGGDNRSSSTGHIFFSKFLSMGVGVRYTLI